MSINDGLFYLNLPFIYISMLFYAFVIVAAWQYEIEEGK